MSHETVRDEVLLTLERNFLGPIAGPDETFSATERETPASRYMTGILFPSESTMPEAEDNGGLAAESRESIHEDEARLSMCNAPNPSSYGISFACRPETASLRISVRCGIYALERDKADKPLRWKRAQFDSGQLDIPVSKERRVERRPLAPGLELRMTFRPPGRDGQLPITATLVNLHPKLGVPWEEISTKCFLQCELAVSAGGGAAASPFAERRSRDVRNLDPEVLQALLLYSHSRVYAVGHGCAADWDPKDEHGAPSSVFMTFIPRHDVHPLVAPTNLGTPPLPLVRLANDGFTETTERLGKLVAAYESWLDGKAGLVEKTPAEFRTVAKEQLEASRSSAARIRKGIAALAEPNVFRAFQLTQKAMLEVFARSKWQKDHNYDPKHPPTYGEEHTWFPFQVAFFLQSLESVANPRSTDRDVCDLLWFPTGGGKTEAYLALTAFTFFLRRLRAKDAMSGDGGGTAVLMRYTLRLLTADQFVRACLLTCAAELVRRGEPALKGTAPISIGLWVGEGTTPNNLDDAATALGALHAGRRLRADQSSPVRLKRCPWCGTIISAAEYSMATDGSAMIIRCRKTACEFRKGIPATVIDEQIYEERPSLIIATVDKFARIPWEPRAGALFSTDGRHPRPDLIIQDELHLISGPLGTIAGLYESAVDELCTVNGVPAKVVASTATIRNAAGQVRQIFNRRLAQFPQPLIDARDSFFARLSTAKPARRFVGLFTPGKTPLTAFIRMAGSLSHAPYASTASDADKDPYWTLIAYFNSLRELGGAIVRVHDDVAEYMKTCAVLDGTDPAHRTLDAVEELTSRANEENLSEVRDRLWDRKGGGGDPFDMVLCSNMISVGLDVPRLGLMAVIGQPKTTAEYIQASSRIGRASPGLVVTLYNWTRSRDRSHYERFIPYHSRLYAEVEATSVTPYSSRARDRALHAVLTTLVRHMAPGLLERGSAGSFRVGDPAVAAQIRALKKRIGDVEDNHADVAEAQAHLDQIAARWENLAVASRGGLTYAGEPDNALLVQFENHVPHNPGFATMNNMRNVDAPAGVYIL